MLRLRQLNLNTDSLPHDILSLQSMYLRGLCSLASVHLSAALVRVSADSQKASDPHARTQSCE
jgi:hypothetical protein